MFYSMYSMRCEIVFLWNKFYSKIEVRNKQSITLGNHQNTKNMKIEYHD
eukprot:UN27843